MLSSTATSKARLGRQLELIGAHLEDVGPVRAQWLERQRRHADIAADGDAPAARLQDVADERGGGRFAVRAGDAEIARRALAQRQELDVADDRDAGFAGARRDRVRRRERVRNARREHQRAHVLEIGRGEIGERHARRSRLGAALWRVVPRQYARAAPLQRQRRGEARAREAQDGDALVPEVA